MRLATLLQEIERSSGPVTGIELARRLGITHAEVSSMLDALRAAGRLGPEIADRPQMASCSSSGSCSMTCPGPDECSLTVNLQVSGLQIRSIG
jgi:hypothetical protein